MGGAEESGLDVTVTECHTVSQRALVEGRLSPCSHVAPKAGRDEAAQERVAELLVKTSVLASP